MSLNIILKRKFAVFNELDKELVDNIKYFYINRSNALFVTRDDVVYRYYQHNNIKQLKVLDQLNFKNVVKFDVSFNKYSYQHTFTHYLALTKSGELYTWGCNKFGQLGVNSTNDCEEPVKNVYLEENHITDACCGEWHTIVLTLNGNVFCFGRNDKGQIGNNSAIDQIKPVNIIFNTTEKLLSISCGLWHSIAVSESGSIFGWGNNECGQLGLPEIRNQISPLLVKTKSGSRTRAAVCGQKFTIIMTEEDELYFSGHIDGKVLSFKYFAKMNSLLKFRKVAASIQASLCVAETVTNECYVLGKYRDETYKEFKVIKESDSKSIDDVFARNLQITYKTTHIDDLIEDFSDNENNEFIMQIEKQLIPNKFATCFEQLCSLGSGSYGNVYKCVDKQDNTHYAIKKIRLVNKDYEKLSREIKINLKLNSKYVVKFYESWFEKNYNLETFDTQNATETATSETKLFYPFLLHMRMELCSLTLRDAISKIEECLSHDSSKLGIGYYIASQLFIEILECVSYLHDHNPQLIHRDLYPSNILLTSFANNRCVKIADFGLSTFYNPEKSLTKDVGATKYRAPEVKSGNYTTKADMYSLGIVAKELFNFEHISSDISRNENIQAKLNNLTSMINKLIDDEKNRPYCKEVLNETCLWSLDFNDIINDKYVDEIIFNPINDQSSIEYNFIEYFLQYKHSTKKDRFYSTLKYKNNFIEICSLGAGGFSTVFKSQHKINNKLYAIKKISTSPESIEKVVRELKFLSQMESDYVVKYYDSWIENNYYIGEFPTSATENISSSLMLFNPYQSLLVHMQMELCPMTLRQSIYIVRNDLMTHNNYLSLIGYYIASELLYEVLEGVQYLHSQNPALIHRDLKPENILLTNFDNNRFVKLGDFGLSTLHEFSDQSHTKYKGTVGYRAPELSFNTHYSTKVDIFSLGVIIQELFHFNINDESYSKHSLLPLKQIIKLSSKSLSGNPGLRPDCTKLLSSNNKWRLTRNQCFANDDFVQIISKDSKTKSIDENFVDFFIQNKFNSNLASSINTSILKKVFHSIFN